MSKAKGVWSTGKKKLSKGKSKFVSKIKSKRGKRKRKKDPWTNDANFPQDTDSEAVTTEGTEKRNPLIPTPAPAESEPDEPQEIVIPINAAYDTDPMTSSENEAGEKKKKRGLVSKAKGMFKWKKYKSKNGIPKEQDLEAGRAIPSAGESDNKEQQQKKKKKGWWRRFKGGVSKRGRSAAVKIGLKKKKNDDGDRGAAICCAHLGFKARMWGFTITHLLGLVSFFLSLFFIWGVNFDLKEYEKLGDRYANKNNDPRVLYAVLYVVGCILTIGSVFFLAGICRQIRVSLRHCRLFSILIVVAAIMINIAVAFPRPRRVKAGPISTATKRRLAETTGDQPAQPAPQQGSTNPQDSPANSPVDQQPSQGSPNPPVDQQPSQGSPNGNQSDQDSQNDQGNPTDTSNGDNDSKHDKWYVWVFPAHVLLLLIQICQVLFWFWYCLTYIPCACLRNCIQHCCSKSKKSKKDNEDKGKEEV